MRDNSITFDNLKYFNPYVNHYHKAEYPIHISMFFLYLCGNVLIWCCCWFIFKNWTKKNLFCSFLCLPQFAEFFPNVSNFSMSGPLAILSMSMLSTITAIAQTISWCLLSLIIVSPGPFCNLKSLEFWTMINFSHKLTPLSRLWITKRHCLTLLQLPTQGWPLILHVQSQDPSLLFSLLLLTCLVA